MKAGSAAGMAGRLGPAAAVLLLLASCASVPVRSPSEWMGVLPSDATMYVSMYVPHSADLIRKTLKQGGPAYNDVVQLADRTSRVVLSVTAAPDAPTRFSAIALGSYPAVLISMSLSGRKEWKQVSSADGSYFLFHKANLQVSLPGGGILLAANGDMPTLLSRYRSPVPLPIPPEVQTDMTRTDVVLYMPQLPGGIGEPSADDSTAAGPGDRPHFPIREVWVNGTKTKDGYTLGATMNTDTEQQARVLALVLRIGIVAWMKSNNVSDAAGRLKDISVDPQGTSVRVNGIAVSDKELIPLFLTLLNGPQATEGEGGRGTDAGSPPPVQTEGAPAEPAQPPPEAGN